MFIQGDRVDSIASKRSAAERFINLRQQKKVKEFLVKLRGYKRPDFNRMILDLCRLKWTHEKISFVLPVSSASTVSEWNFGELKQVLNVFHAKVNGKRINMKLVN